MTDLHTPIQNDILDSYALGIADSDLSLVIKRLDLLHPVVNGNKWYKLKYNLEQARQRGIPILTFGGPWSNHIYATAGAGKINGIQTIGIIRGEEYETLSTATLDHARACGMRLHFITRSAYAEKDTEDFTGWLHEEFGSFHLVPEGGSNFLGINGCMEILDEKAKEFDYVCCACGTGATLAGLLLSAGKKQKLLGFSSLKNGDFLREEVLRHLKYFLGDERTANEFSTQFGIITDYHFGGYGKWNDELLSFIRSFALQHKIPLDQVYTGKMMYGIIDMMKKGHFEKGSRILVIHTGGIQGTASLSAS